MNKKTVLCLAVCSALTSIYSVANAETRPSYRQLPDVSYSQRLEGSKKTINA